MSKRFGKQVRGRLRWLGWSFVIITTPVLMAAWNTGLNLLYIVTAMLLTFFILSLLLARWNLRRISLEREAPRSIHRGVPVMTHVRIENRRRFLPAISLSVERADRRGESAGYVLKIPPRQAAEITIRDCFQKRGVYALPPLEVVTSFPFGLLERRRRFDDGLEVVVYPRVRIVRTTAIEQASGSRTVARIVSGDGDEYFGLREYVNGDDTRHIAWRISARMRTWMIREWTRDNSKYVLFILDTRIVGDVEGFDDYFEEAVELVASLSVMLLSRQYEVSIVTPTAKLDAGQGKGHERRILEMLARVEAIPPGEQPGFDSVAQSLASLPGTILYVSPDPRRWGRRSAFGALNVLDPRGLIHA